MRKYPVTFRYDVPGYIYISERIEFGIYNLVGRGLVFLRIFSDINPVLGMKLPRHGLYQMEFVTQESFSC